MLLQKIFARKGHRAVDTPVVTQNVLGKKFFILIGLFALCTVVPLDNSLYFLVSGVVHLIIVFYAKFFRAFGTREYLSRRLTPEKLYANLRTDVFFKTVSFLKSLLALYALERTFRRVTFLEVKI